MSCFPLISIIIPTYNRGNVIVRTLESIKNQTFNDWECIIVDDGSTDNTSSLLKEYIRNDLRFSYYERPSERKKGPSACRNYGFEKSKGNWIKWFDSDDVLLSDALIEIQKYFDLNIDVVISNMEYIYENKNKLPHKLHLYSKNLIEDYLTGKIVYYTPNPTWNKFFLLNQEELFDENIRNLDDWDFNLRMLYNDPKIIYLDKVLMHYIIHDNSLSMEIKKFNFNEIQSEIFAREKHLILIKNNQKADLKVFKKFVLHRYKYFLRIAFLKNHYKKKYIFKKLFILEVSLFDVFALIKTTFGYVFFSFFKKGYRFLK